MPSVLFVCLGNICRSPAAEGILQSLAEKKGVSNQLKVESCGIGGWHVGELADERMRVSAKTRGIVLTGRAKKFDTVFFADFDLILAADHEVLHDLYRYAKTPEQKAKLHLICDFCEYYRGQDIPDPYYGGDAGFDLVLDMLEDACQGILEHFFKKVDPSKRIT